MKKYFFFFTLLFSLSAFAQKSDSNAIIALNQQIDDLVVKGDTNVLRDFYSDDFVFSHGTGNIDNRSSWLRVVAKGGFTLRNHTGVTVELHSDIALLRGQLNVQKLSSLKVDNYFVQYVRAYAWRDDRWKIISHFTFYEEHR